MERISCARTNCGLDGVGCQIWYEILVFTVCCVMRLEDLYVVSLQAGLGLGGLMTHVRYPSLTGDAFSWSLRGA